MLELEGSSAMTFYNERTKELKDKKILDALEKAKTMYENGEIAEVEDILVDIVNAIDAFATHAS